MTMTEAELVEDHFIYVIKWTAAVLVMLGLVFFAWGRSLKIIFGGWI